MLERRTEAPRSGPRRAPGGSVQEGVCMMETRDEAPRSGPRRAPGGSVREGVVMMGRRDGAPRSGPRRAPGGSVRRSRKSGKERMIYLFEGGAFDEAFFELVGHLRRRVDVDELWVGFTEGELFEEVLEGGFFVLGGGRGATSAGELLLEALVEGGREDEGLSLQLHRVCIVVIVGGRVGCFFTVEEVEDLFEFFEVALAQEAVGLVDNQELHFPQPVDDSVAGADDLPESPWRADDNISGGELTLLLLERQAAGDGSDVGGVGGVIRAEGREMGR